MLPHQAVEALGQQDGLDPLAERGQQVVNDAFAGAGPAGQAVKDALHGTWLGHSLHPALTDIPIGAWTVALVFDVAESMGGRRDLGPGADAAVTVGLVGALGAAATGRADWSATDGSARRVGLVHGLLNLGVTGLYLASLRRRGRGDRRGGLWRWRWPATPRRWSRPTWAAT